MGRDHDEQGPAVAGPHSARIWARRAILSALTGGGLTAVGLAGPLSGPAAAAESSPGQSSTSTTGTSTTGTSTTPAPETPTQTTTTTTATSTGTTGTTTSPSATTTTTPTPPGSTTTTTTSPSTTTTTPAELPTSTAQTSQPSASVKQLAQKPDSSQASSPATQGKTSGSSSQGASANVAPAPQLAAAQSQALAAMLAATAASEQALSFYRIPLFLLPIYQAAGVQYGVPWEVLAAINEVETDFGTDLSVSTAGAVGWMQFMPETWLQYGVDALNAGYADPYNPVDAIFAAARYLHAAGASSDLRTAIFAYNHSEAYVESVLLRARLFASYPPSVIATLTGLTEGSAPVAGARLSALAPADLSSSSATSTGATSSEATTGSGQDDGSGEGDTSTGTGGDNLGSSTSAGTTAGAASVQPGVSALSAHSSTLPGSTPAPSPAVSAERAERAQNAPAPASQLSKLAGRAGAPVVAVEDGRIVAIGYSRKLGHYLVLRDTYGDLFTYAGLGSIAPAFHLPKPAQLQVAKGTLQSGETTADPTPKQAASAGRQLPLTLHVAKRRAAVSASGDSSVGAGASVSAGKVRVYAHPGNPDARAAARVRAQQAHRNPLPAGWTRLTRGAVVAQGTVLGHLGAGEGESGEATLRFAIRPTGAQSAIDPQPILENWKQLEIALHPEGAKTGQVLAGATAADAFLLSRSELQSAVLSDPGIQLGSCDREQVAAGKVNRQALALLVFLSRSGLKPTVGKLRCGQMVDTRRGVVASYPSSGTLDIAAINGVPIAGHQGAGTVTDVTIRTLLTIESQYAPKRIVSLMSYPGAPSTVAEADHADFIEVQLGGKGASASASTAALGAAAHAAGASSEASTNAANADIVLNTGQWQQLVTKIGDIQPVKLSRKPSSAAVRDK